MKTVIGMFDEFAAAQRAVDELLTRGFDRADISIAGHGPAAGLKADADLIQQKDERREAMEESAKTGAGTGAVIGTLGGGTLGLLAGLGTIVLPGIGPVIAAGPLIAMLTGAGLGAAAGAAVGGLVGALTRVGVPEHDAHFYAEAVRRGGTLVLVAAPEDRVRDAADALEECGAVDVDKRRAALEAEGFSEHDVAATPYSLADVERERTGYLAEAEAIIDQTEVVVPVIEEDLRVGKRVVDRGCVRVYTHLVEEPVEERVNLREQHAVVERRAVDRPLMAGDAAAFQDQRFEVVEYTEEPVIARRRGWSRR